MGAPVARYIAERASMQAWLVRWRRRFAEDGSDPAQRVARMRASNPAFIPRNHRVEEMIEAAVGGDLQPLQRLRELHHHRILGAVHLAGIKPAWEAASRSSSARAEVRGIGRRDLGRRAYAVAAFVLLAASAVAGFVSAQGGRRFGIGSGVRVFSHVVS